MTLERSREGARLRSLLGAMLPAAVAAGQRAEPGAAAAWRRSRACPAPRHLRTGRTTQVCPAPPRPAPKRPPPSCTAHAARSIPSAQRTQQEPQAAWSLTGESAPVPFQLSCLGSMWGGVEGTCRRWGLGPEVLCSLRGRRGRAGRGGVCARRCRRLEGLEVLSAAATCGPLNTLEDASRQLVQSR